TIAGYAVRKASEDDLEACNRVCLSVHGHDRSGEVVDGIREGSARVVEHGGRITGYTTGIAFFAHSVSESNEALKALIAAAREFGGPGFLLPARNAELYRWCLAHRLKVVQVLTLMTLGLYNEPAGAYLPSILYLYSSARAGGRGIELLPSWLTYGFYLRVVPPTSRLMRRRARGPTRPRLSLEFRTRQPLLLTPDPEWIQSRSIR